MWKNSSWSIPSSCTEAAQQIYKSCIQHNHQEMLIKQKNKISYLEANNMFELMAKFDDKKEANVPLFKFMRRYMRMVLPIYYGNYTR